MPQELHPLAGRKVSIAERGSLDISAAEERARFSLRIAPDHLPRASAAFGGALPARIGETGASGGRLAVCLGPDEWQLYAPLDERDAIEAAFAAFYAECPHSLVDIGHREVGIAVQGTAAMLALRSACALDLDAMPVGAAKRTIFDKAQVVLFREGEERFRIEVWRSFADHVWGLLQAASREVALGI